MDRDKYAGSEHMREHPAYREGYDRGYHNGYMEAMQRVVDELLPSLQNSLQPQPIIIPAQNIHDGLMSMLASSPEPTPPAPGNDVQAPPGVKGEDDVSKEEGNETPMPEM